MGYSVDMVVDVVIPAEQVEPFRQRLLKLHEEEERAGPIPVGLGLVKMMEEHWGWTAVAHADGAVQLVRFDGENFTDYDEALLFVMGPFALGEIKCIGEDLRLWGYRYEDGKMWALPAELVLVSEPDEPWDLTV